VSRGVAAGNGSTLPTFGKGLSGSPAHTGKPVPDAASAAKDLDHMTALEHGISLQ
jgi:hypothetical protein